MTRLCLGFVAWIWILASFCIGCASTQRASSVPGAVEAARIVWAHYGRTDSVPRVVALRPDCTKPGDRVGVRDPWGRCVGGWTMSDGVVHTIWQAGGSWSQDTALAHELLHAAWMREGMKWPHHIEGLTVAQACALPGTLALCVRHQLFYGVVDGANKVLAEKGM